ncbi:hypothetical protein [Microbacterium aurantiacum]|uniref:Uncharacterized protein n=1 Tax=Microbacterium aurantiacum TaxID=162393 RepID=A0A0M9VKW8_9MICO|nr:hypothetical protein [Microbacterium chocolatum]ANG85054.1 hypothetical protein A8L33_06360 [Microbacterium chocolatum]KOS10232.1 hypothetical protein XI38_12130 [Microbacterium chocolatum]
MNSTNRALNRIVLLILGIVLVGIGGIVATAASVPVVADTWATSAEAVQQWATGAWESTQIAGTQLTWVAVALLAVFVLLIALLITLVARGVRGRRQTAFGATGANSEAGRVTVTEGFASDLLKNALTERDEILTAKVTASDVKKQPVLHVSVTARQNTSPVAVAETVDQLVTNLAALTGRRLPTYISVHSGLRARLAHDQRRLN